ncbi:hypothetical protein ACV3OC_11245 [Clostridium perfringens]|nr:hypothetical protein [Clostridium perfringens]MDU7725953.1 hypothetical protein [Clostridium perfringens]
MLVKDVLDHICKKENVLEYREIPLSRWSEFQNNDIKKHINFIEDIDFEEFYGFLNSIFDSRVNRPTAIKILNNGYFR